MSTTAPNHRRSPHRKLRNVGIIVAATAILASACSDDDDTDAAPAATDATTAGTSTEETEPASGTSAATETSSVTDATEPPDGTAAAEPAGVGSDTIECSPGAIVTPEMYPGGESGTGYETEQGPVGSVNPPVQSVFPEEVPTTPFPTVSDGQVIVVESFGMGQGAFHLAGPREGSLGYVNVATGADIWAPVGGLDGLLAIAGAENYRPRGARGVRESVITFFDSNGHAIDEICLPRNQYSSAGGTTPQLTADGRHVVIFDRRLPGYLLIDVESREIVDDVTVDPTCLPGIHFADATSGYLVCWRSGEVLEVSIGDGTIETGEAAVAFTPETPILDGTVQFSPSTGMMTVLTRFSEVLEIDLSDGLPSEPSEPIDIAEPDHIVRTGEAYLTPDGTTQVVGYVEGDDYASDTPTIWRVFDTQDWSETNRLEMPEGDLAAVLPTPDSSELWVLVNEVEVPAEEGEEDSDEPETASFLVKLDLASGEETSRVELENTSDGEEFTDLYNPVTVG